MKSCAFQHDIRVQRSREDDLVEGRLGVRPPLSLDPGPRPGGRFGAEEDGVESPPTVHFQWAPFPLEPFAILAPGRVVEGMHGALLIERQAGDDLGPGGDPREIVGQLRDRPEPRRLVIAAGEDGLAVGAERHGRDRGLDASGVGRGAGPSPRPRAAPSCHRSR